MAKPSSSSTLYRLIEAGQLAHRALVVPLGEHGLEPGDDAILFALGRAGMSEILLAEELDLAREQLAPRLERLLDRNLVHRPTTSPQFLPAIALTEHGLRVRSLLAENWAELEVALLGDLKKKHRKQLSRVLERFISLLRL